MVSGMAPPQKSRLRREQAALGSGRSAKSSGGGRAGREGGDEGAFIPRPPSPYQKRSLEILVLAGSVVLEALGLGDPAGRGRRLWAGGSGN